VVIKNTETPEIMSHNLTFQILFKKNCINGWLQLLPVDKNHWHEFAVQRWHSFWSM